MALYVFFPAREPMGVSKTSRLDGGATLFVFVFDSLSLSPSPPGSSLSAVPPASCTIKRKALSLYIRVGRYLLLRSLSTNALIL